MADQLTFKNTTLANSSTLPVAADVITTSEVVFVNPKVKTGDYSDIGNGMLGGKKTYIDGNYVTAEFDIKTQMKKATALGTVPSLDELFKICGLSETVTAATKVEYKPGGVSAGAGQIKSFVDGYVRSLTGVAGSFKISAKVGEPLVCAFSVKGFLASAAATIEANPAVTLDTNFMPLVSKVSVLTAGGVTLQADSFDFDLGNDIQESYAIGMAKYYLANFDPTITVTAVKVKGTDETAWGDFSLGTIRSIIIQVGVAGGMIELSIPFAVLKEVSESDGNGLVKISRTFRAQASVGNDNFVITYK